MVNNDIFILEIYISKRLKYNTKNDLHFHLYLTIINIHIYIIMYCKKCCDTKYIYISNYIFILSIILNMIRLLFTILHFLSQ